LDVIEVELGEECGSNYHPEDVSVTEKRWRPVRRFDSADDLRFLVAFLNKGPTLLKGYGDRVYDRAFSDRPLDRSLELIRPDDLWWWIRDESGKRKNRALFRFGHVNRTHYDLAVTDPVWLDRLHSMPAGIYAHASFFREKSRKPVLTVSLSEPFERFHYKLVAGVIDLPA
jgi:Dual OB-containing domain